jgi:ketosteroid isomerase-like protein
MRKTILFLAMSLYAASMFAADAAEEARKSETAFAKAFASQDQEKFFSFVAPDAQFLGPRRVLSGKAKVREVWSHFFEGHKAPFSWAPDRVVANAAGNLALSTGPIHDDEGNLIGNYASIWQKEADGSWRIIFDGPGSGPPCPPPAAPPSSPPAP